MKKYYNGSEGLQKVQFWLFKGLCQEQRTYFSAPWMTMTRGILAVIARPPLQTSAVPSYTTILNSSHWGLNLLHHRDKLLCQVFDILHSSISHMLCGVNNIHQSLELKPPWKKEWQKIFDTIIKQQMKLSKQQYLPAKRMFVRGHLTIIDPSPIAISPSNCFSIAIVYVFSNNRQPPTSFLLGGT